MKRQRDPLLLAGLFGVLFILALATAFAVWTA